MDKVEILIDNLRKECFAKFVGVASLEGMEGRLMNKFPEFERKLDQLKEDGNFFRNHHSTITWDINEIKAQLFDLKSTSSELTSKVDKLIEEAHSIDYQVEIEELLKKINYLEKMLGEKVDCDTFDRDLNQIRFTF